MKGVGDDNILETYIVPARVFHNILILFHSIIIIQFKNYDHVYNIIVEGKIIIWILKYVHDFDKTFDLNAH